MQTMHQRSTLVRRGTKKTVASLCYYGDNCVLSTLQPYARPCHTDHRHCDLYRPQMSPIKGLQIDSRQFSFAAGKKRQIRLACFVWEWRFAAFVWQTIEAESGSRSTWGRISRFISGELRQKFSFHAQLRDHLVSRH